MSSAATESTGRKMKSVNGLEGAGITFVRPSKLEGAQTLVTEALYLGSTPNNFDEDKADYKFENADGTITVINGAGNLGYQMGKVPVNSIVTVDYKGKQEIKKGKLKGKMSHNFNVLIAE
ncbi:MAG: hypothetical protein ACAH17_03645 [Candidatus Paceibacterota bacterium]